MIHAGASVVAADLPEAVLAVVLGHLSDPRDGLAVLLTCRAWHRAAVRSGVVWRRVSLTPRRLQCLVESDVSLARVAANCQRLELGAGCFSRGAAPCASSLLSGLQRLACLEVGPLGCRREAAPLWQDLPPLTRLTHLSLSLCNLAAGAGCGPGSPLLGLQQTLAALPLLASLTLGVDGVAPSSSSRALPLHGLPGLSRLALLCDPGWRCAVAAVPTLDGTTGLEELEVEGCRLSLLPAQAAGLLPCLRRLALHDADLGGEQGWAALPLLPALTRIAIHPRRPRQPPALPPAAATAVAAAAAGGGQLLLAPRFFHGAGMGVAAGTPALSSAGTGDAAGAAVGPHHTRWAALLACQGLQELAVCVNPYEASRLPELPHGAWPCLTTLRLVPNCLVGAWPKPGRLPDSWCAGLPALRTLCLIGGEWSLPWGLSKLGALEELEVERLSGPFKPLAGLWRLTRLVVRGSHAEALPPGPYLSCLQHLQLSGSGLLCLPPVLAAARRLRVLDVSHNPRLRVAAGDTVLLRQLPALAQLRLSWQQPKSTREAEGQRMLHAFLCQQLPHVAVDPPPEAPPEYAAAQGAGEQLRREDGCSGACLWRPRSSSSSAGGDSGNSSSDSD